MQNTLPCPVCQNLLTVLTTPPGLACPFCRAAIRFADGKIPVGARVRCGKCYGVFKAESPPPGIRVYAASVEACPSCRIPLAYPKVLPPGKMIRCPKCQTKFQPAREQTGAQGQGEPGPEGDPAGPAAPAPVVPRAPVRPASKTNLMPRVGRGDGAGAPGEDEFAEAGGAAAGPDTAAPRKLNGSGVTRLAASRPGDGLGESPDAPARTPSVAEDEVDYDAPAPPAPLDGELRPPPPAISDTKQLPRPAAAPPAPEAPDPAVNGPPATGEAPPAADAPPADDGDAAQPTADFVEESAPPPVRAAKVKQRPAGRALSAPTATAQGKAVRAKKPAVPAARRRAPGARPAVAANQAAQAETAAQPQAATTAPPQQPAAATPAPRPAPARPFTPPVKKADGKSLEINLKKLLLFGLPVLLVVGVGVYFYFAQVAKPWVYPVEGVVLFQGQPAVGARVTLFPVAKSRHRYLPTGVVGEDGKFKLTTFKPDDGCPAGKYSVAIVRGELDPEKYKELQAKHSPEELERILEEMQLDPLFGSKYANPKFSGLKAEIKASSANKLEFVLN
jgi:predicted Zn finger-like uncharacterized protein